MMISTKGRYALRVMVDLAEHQTGGYIPLKEIAKRQNISEKYLEIILKSLVREKVIIGLRGKGGGYRMSGAPEQLTVGKILRLTEGDMVPVACLAPEAPPCPMESRCRTLPMWRDLNARLQRFFAGITIADLMKTSLSPEEALSSKLPARS